MHIDTNDEFAAGFDPQMLMEDALAQAAEFSWLPTAINKWGAGVWESRAYLRYVSANNPNQPASRRQLKTSVTIHHRVLGMVVLDILQGDIIGGIEFVDRLE
ncbi:hypothetical protein [Massilia sp. CF038]|uniref:hypothetical protein n=1 Tax=Massilia sp. CF038 TaxID=1881045 RepID=UPI000914977A|nr:hypothetical protein [Massilia sp. CF038]SHG37951.1 hypothetical protein SAMN05428948_0165 [Massilia sp. CF038]